jgi:hypothetical protein
MCWYIKQVSVKAGNKTQKAQNHPPKPQGARIGRSHAGAADGLVGACILMRWRADDSAGFPVGESLFLAAWAGLRASWKSHVFATDASRVLPIILFVTTR